MESHPSDEHGDLPQPATSPLDEPFRIKTAGHLRPYMTVSVGPAACGEIVDGVAFDNGQGSWVVDYSDLLVIVDAATKARTSTKGDQ